jgi:hypothetical protein
MVNDISGVVISITNPYIVNTIPMPQPVFNFLVQSGMLLEGGVLTASSRLYHNEEIPVQGEP